MLRKRKLPFLLNLEQLQQVQKAFQEQGIPFETSSYNSVRDAGATGMAVDRFLTQETPGYQISVEKEKYDLAVSVLQRIMAQ